MPPWTPRAAPAATVGAVVDVVFVAPYAMEATNRFLAAFLGVGDARVAVVSNEPLERFPESLRGRFAAHWRVGDCLDADQLAHGVGSVGAALGGIDVLTGILEPLQVPLAQVRDRLGIAGMNAETAENFRDKARMKAVFDRAGIPCARHARVDSADAARGVHHDWRTPVVVKPLAGMGAKSTFRLDDADAIERWLAQSPPTVDAPVLMEEFLTGREFSFESVLVDGELVWHSICRYDPTPLTVVENPWIQWSVVLPRRIDGDEFAAIRTVGADAVRSLGMSTGLSHLEWFPSPRRLGGDLGGRRPAAGRPDRLADVVGARHRHVRRVGGPGDARCVHPARAEVRGGSRLPAGTRCRPLDHLGHRDRPSQRTHPPDGGRVAAPPASAPVAPTATRATAT